MTKQEPFGEISNVTVTALVDNMTDMLLTSTEVVKRYTQESGEPLLAEHGLSLLLELKDQGIKILWDGGITHVTLNENMSRMKINPSDFDMIVLSHGHPDHIIAITDIINKISGTPKARNWDKDIQVSEIQDWINKRRIPLISHPAAYRERWKVFADGSKYGPMVTPKEEWEAAGAKIIVSETPYKLSPGCWTTGQIPRLTFEKAGTPPIFAYRDGDNFVRDFVDDDQAIILNIKGKGLVIVAGCAHSGIINTINHAKKISGVEKVHAVLGGFHLISSSREEIQMTIDELKKFEPVMIVPSHCTGFPAINQLALQMPQEFVLGVVGTSYLF